ncbi:MAG: right-handed parallel beta-helix repeat-containing protein [Thermoleophilia bacterium]|nr:right-handed parallel beta-helix repeat-containing protein [Thermoleophilia bacterium]
MSDATYSQRVASPPATRARRPAVSWIRGILFFAVALFLLPGPVAAAAEVIHIRDDAAGGDCFKAGVWDAGTKSCTLTGDFSGKFVIESDGVTLDGAGYTVTGAGPDDPADFVPGPDGGGDAVYVYRRTGVTIKNIFFTRFDYSVNLVESSNVTVTGITSSLSGLAGISLEGASGNVLAANTISNPGINTGICVGYGSTGNTITGNTISDSARGIYLHTLSDGNAITYNSLTGNDWGLTLFEADSGNLLQGNIVSGGIHGIYLNDESNDAIVRNNTISGAGTGIRLENVTGAAVYHNNFLDNAIQAQMIGSGANSFNRPAPEGGNFWSEHGSEGGSCGGGGVCDAPYQFDGCRDNRAWGSKDGWAYLLPPPGQALGSSYWASYGDYAMRLLSVDLRAAWAGSTAADQVAGMISGINGLNLASLAPEGGSPVRGMVLKSRVPGGMVMFRPYVFPGAGDSCGES